MKKETGILKPASKAEKKNALELELGRYKKAVQTREIVIGQLKEEMAGYKELLDVISAYIIYLVPEDQEVRIKKDDIIEIISESKYELQTEATDTEYVVKKIKKAGN